MLHRWLPALVGPHQAAERPHIAPDLAPCFLAAGRHPSCPTQPVGCRPQRPIPETPPDPSSPMEFVFVVPRSDVFPATTSGDSAPHGFDSFGGNKPCLGDLATEAGATQLLESSGFFVERARAEVTPAWKQPIPYALVYGPQGVLCLRRKRAGSEARLHDKLSIGVGGHVEPIDLPDADNPADRTGLLARTALRELHEELILEGAAADAEVRLLGLLNDDTNPVGAVHLGLVCAVHVADTAAVRVREEDILEGEFLTPAELLARHEQGANFESWTELLLPHLESLLDSSAAPDPSRDSSKTTVSSRS